MFRFFRQIRQKLLSDNKFGKYLLYIIVEIFIVIIGILIAIQVDNWNEDRIGTENTKLLFQEVSEELVENIKNIDGIINLYIQKDSLYFKVLNKRVKDKDYKASSFLFHFPLLYDRTSLVDEGFKELLARKHNLTEQQDSIFLELKDLYGKRKINTDRDDISINEAHLNFRNKMMNELPWWSNYETKDVLTDEMIQYALTDPFYLNQLSELEFREYWHTMGILWFRSKALNLYKKITEMLEIEKDTTLVKDIADFEYIKGVYEYKWYKFNIRGENELKANLFINDSTVLEWGVYPYSNSHLIFYGQEKGDNWLCKIEFGKNGEVLRLIRFGDMIEVDGNRRMMKKIE